MIVLERSSILYVERFQIYKTGQFGSDILVLTFFCEGPCLSCPLALLRMHLLYAPTSHSQAPAPNRDFRKQSLLAVAYYMISME